MKTKEECLCFEDVEAVRDFNLQGIFVLSRAIILLELTHNLYPFDLVTRRGFKTTKHV